MAVGTTGGAQATIASICGRLVRQLLAESLVVAPLAGLAGFGAAFVLSAVIVRFGEVPADFAELLALDGRALLAATAIGVSAVVLFGVAPALTTTRFDVLPVLKDEGTTSTSSRGANRLRRALVVAQIALSLMLLVVAPLFFQSLSRARRGEQERRRIRVSPAPITFKVSPVDANTWSVFVIGFCQYSCHTRFNTAFAGAV